jgi:hypothetical protein
MFPFMVAWRLLKGLPKGALKTAPFFKMAGIRRRRKLATFPHNTRRTF